MVTFDRVAQRTEALARANHVRVEIAGVKREVRGLPYRSALAYVARFLEECDSADPRTAISVGHLLTSVPNFGPSRVSRLTYSVGIYSNDKPIRDLTVRQRERLADDLRDLCSVL